VKTKTPITLEYTRSFFDIAQAEFAFLREQGFQLTEAKPPTSISFKDGFHLLYSRRPVDVVVEYYDMELIPAFRRGADTASYYSVDRYLFATASNLAGAMFPLDTLASVLRRVATDMREHYQLVLAGDDATWRKIMAQLNAPTQKRFLP